jgi:hypothetical protein
VAHAREVPSYDYGYLWSPEVYGRDKVTALANTWWSLPVNKYNCWSCCVGASNENIVDDAICESAAGHACRRGLLPMLDAQDMGTPGFSKAGHWDWGGPDAGWNHIDQLAVCVGKSWYGPGLSPVEQIAQFSLWCVLASPLLVSVDVRSMSPECAAIVTNARAIAVHQSASKPGRRLKNIAEGFQDEGAAVPAGAALALNATVEPGALLQTPPPVVAAQVWGRPLVGGAVAAVFFNRAEAVRDVAATFGELGLAPGVKTVTATDVWSGKVTKGVVSPITASAVEAHAVTFVTLTPE